MYINPMNYSYADRNQSAMKHLSKIIILSLLAVACSKNLKQKDPKAELESYIETKKSEVNPRYRLQYHVSPPVGWMNDPNGFSFYKGEYHLFYQFYPYDSVWGPMHWGHVSSTDLVNWKQLPTALLPDEEQCFSGSAVVDGDTLVLMYTAHIVTEIDPFFNQTQYLAFSTDGVDFVKYSGNPVLSAAPNGIADFRDPKVWRHEDHWYAVIGSTTDDEKGRVLLYRSKDMKSWDFLSVLGESNGNLGYMWECPDFFELNGKHVLLMSPQGLAPVGDEFVNIYQTGYIIGSFDYETFEFKQETEFKEIDFGHDFYASQTTQVDGKVYVIAWLGTWEQSHPEDKDGWANAMTIVRELSLSDDNRILSKPVDAMTTLRGEVVFDGTLDENDEVLLDKSVEILVGGGFDKKIELLIEGTEGGEKTSLLWDPDVGKVVVSRNGDIRQREWIPVGQRSWRIFVDTSSLELFCGEGEAVFSARIYPEGDRKLKNLSPYSSEVLIYQLNRSVPE